MPKILDVGQAAEALAVHPETIRRWLREKRITGTRLSVQAGWRIPESEVERLLAEGDASPEALEHRAKVERIARVEERLEAAAATPKRRKAS